MQRVPDEELTALIAKAAEQGLDRHTNDAAAAALKPSSRQISRRARPRNT